MNNLAYVWLCSVSVGIADKRRHGARDGGDTCLTLQGAWACAGMSTCILSPAVAMPKEPLVAGSCHPLNSSRLVVVPGERYP